MFSVDLASQERKYFSRGFKDFEQTKEPLKECKRTLGSPVLHNFVP